MNQAKILVREQGKKKAKQAIQEIFAELEDLQRRRNAVVAKCGDLNAEVMSIHHNQALQKTADLERKIEVKKLREVIADAEELLNGHKAMVEPQ